MPSKIKSLARRVDKIADQEGYAEAVNDVITSAIICWKTHYFYHNLKRVNFWLFILCKEICFFYIDNRYREQKDL